MKQSFENLVKLMEKLRSEEGCPRDKEQTFETKKEHIINEAKEVVEAIDKKDNENLKEELGDLLFNVIFISRLAEEKNLFDIKQVMDTVHEKLVRRHPHVFGNAKADTPEEADKIWDEVKAAEKKK